MITRRQFVQRAGISLAGASILDVQNLFAQSQPYLSFDFHTHPGMFLGVGAADPAVAKTINEMNTGGLSGAFFTLVADAPIIKVGPNGVSPEGSYKPGEAWKEYKRQLGILKEVIAKSPVTASFNGADLQKAYKAKKVAAYIGIEGGDFLEGDASKLDEMYADGVRSIQIVHYHPNELGNLQTADAQHPGMSGAGKEVVKKMNKLGMLVDVAHAAQDTVKAVVDVTDAPIILSHSVLQVDTSRPISRRAISAEHAKLVASTGGVIGAWPSGYNTSFDDFIDNIKKLADVVGTDHIGLGTDMDGNFKPVLSSFLQLPQWIDALKKKGFTEAEVKKIAGENAERVLKKVLK